MSYSDAVSAYGYTVLRVLQVLRSSRDGPEGGLEALTGRRQHII